MSIYRLGYLDVAATVQQTFEAELLAWITKLRRKYPDYDRLIFTGGCALNCVANQRLLDSGLFKAIYVPPFPGDESIALGAASHLKYRVGRAPWQPREAGEQIPCFGPAASVPREKDILREFAGFKIVRPPDIAVFVAGRLAQGKILAWMQGRSESGPRALGYRSLLADPRIPDLKTYLNKRIKFRESFRPYAGSCMQSMVAEYFEVDRSFESPFMSFTPRLRPEYRKRLDPIAHIDGRSRVQTVRPEQNPRFHELLENFGRRTGLYAVLNTSLNVMGEPIVETVADAARFLRQSPVDGIAVGDFYVFNSSSSSSSNSSGRA
jgi:carbamoyltransferase